jgi:hypothetical protein
MLEETWENNANLYIYLDKPCFEDTEHINKFAELIVLKAGV